LKYTADDYLRPLKKLSSKLDKLVEGRLWLKVLIALFLGICLGFILGPELGLLAPDTVKIITSWIALPGQLFLALIQMIVVPLIIASVVRGLAANSDTQAMKKIGLLAIAFIIFTTVLGTATGIGLAQAIKPGHYIDSSSLNITTDNNVTPMLASGFPAAAEMPDKLIGLFPKNPISSMVSGEMLQVILFSAILGFALMSIPAKQAKPLFDLLEALQEVSMRVVSWAMYLAPLAVFGLITRLVANLGIEVLSGMLMYVLTVIAGLVVLSLFYFLVIKFVAKFSLQYFITEIKELLLLSFSTSSSAAVMPLTLQVTENTFKVRPGIARFLIPVGATINMTGTALYQGVATVFLAQIFQIELTMTNYIFVVTMAVAASIGSPATPGAGIVILSMVLEGVGIPSVGIAFLLGVDRILDMCRTAINVMGDVVMCCLVDKFVPAENDSVAAAQ
jgi:Na+/H+-dicarboxylate symporter